MPFWTCPKCAQREEFSFQAGKPWEKHRCVQNAPILKPTGTLKDFLFAAGKAKIV